MATARKPKVTPEDVPENVVDKTTEGATFAEAAKAATPAPEEPSKGYTLAEVVAGPAPDHRVGLPDHSTDVDPDAEPESEPDAEPDKAV